MTARQHPHVSVIGFMGRCQGLSTRGIRVPCGCDCHPRASQRSQALRGRGADRWRLAILQLAPSTFPLSVGVRSSAEVFTLFPRGVSVPALDETLASSRLAIRQTRA